MAENHNGSMDIDGEKAEDDLASDESVVGSDDMDSEDDDAQQKVWSDKKILLQEKVRILLFLTLAAIFMIFSAQWAR